MKSINFIALPRVIKNCGQKGVILKGKGGIIQVAYEVKARFDYLKNPLGKSGNKG
ncbi:hypothetical protein QWY31_09030 [Cytophagales bacterium LB-30]|uniref:Uncharacterized protein n=1 Tax=Shiella aurantiaca TaxID=3058365 RepID=A0ABT8F5U5_9BACT|nr:hypothetical protein [Shiella aurantiaca]MDN4165644.1 hypothetical protein [Shiella aurantiaca]